MKIGILTFHRALNYGAVLQCYALMRYLQEHGHEVKIVDYRPDGIEKYRQFFPKDMVWKRQGFLMKLKGFLVSLLLLRKKIKARRAFDFFLDRYIPTTKRITKSNTACLNEFDCLIMGSDQVWSPTICDGFDPIYWGCFPHQNVKLITYAASIGGHNYITEDMWQEIGHMLNNYSAISVREEKLFSQIKERFLIQLSLVVDPTILLEKNHFDDIAIRPQVSDYVLFFNLDTDPQAGEFALKIGEILQCKVISIVALQEFSHNKTGIEEIFSVTPQAFLGYFKYAKFIVTTSFHGTVFSVVFGKDFYSLKWEQSDRAQNFLESLGLGSRLMNKEAVLEDVSYVDYNGVDRKMAQNRLLSMEFLNKALV